ncbi:MAG: arginine--pyruvate transaminase AruH [marine bacterium B5-7]|nr:MAG: arginine--pyruvate transaminase AruH [marine bacterium B5-7]
MSVKLSAFVERIGGFGASAWDIHIRAVAAKQAGRDVIILSIGDPDFDTPAPVIAATRTALESGDTHYTQVVGRQDLRQAIAELHQGRCGQVVPADQIAIVAGAQTGLFCASLCLGEPGCEIITTDPVYSTYEATLSASGARLVKVPLDADNGFRFDLATFEAAITDRTRAVYLANPNNPTGRVLSLDEMLAIALLARQNNFWIVADEVYADLVFNGQFHYFAELPEVHDRLITVASFSKSHAMTGWRLGWLVMPPSLKAHMENLLLVVCYGIPGFIQAGGMAAISACESDIALMRDAYSRRLDIAVRGLGKCESLRCLVPDAGMFMLVDVRQTGLDSGDFAIQLYENTGVSVLDARAFGESATGYVRLSFAASESQIEEGCRRIVAFVESL